MDHIYFQQVEPFAVFPAPLLAPHATAILKKYERGPRALLD
jgi:hypothetical protein